MKKNLLLAFAAFIASGCVSAKYLDPNGGILTVTSVARKSALNGLVVSSDKEKGTATMRIQNSQGQIDGESIGTIIGVALKTAATK